ncbi:MAG: hypothetical protein RJQ04_11035 [Longimicrobiales bacterium]
MKFLKSPTRVPVLAIAGLLALGACDDDDDLIVPDDTESYAAVLAPMNESGVTGTVSLTIEDDATFRAEVDAVGLAPEMLHPQHIHFAESCPTVAADANNDGFVDVVEGVPTYGGILVPLDGDLTDQSAGQPDGFPTATAAGTISFDRTANLDAMLADLTASDPNPDDPVVKLEGDRLRLTTRTVVLHGVSSETELPSSVQSIGSAPATLTLPVACGQVVFIG